MFHLTFENPANIDSVFYLTKSIPSWDNIILSINSPTDSKFLKQQKDKTPEETTMQTSSEYVIINHKLNYMDDVDFLFNSGDSVKISYTNNRPKVSIFNRSFKKHDYDVEYLLRDKINSNENLILSQYNFARHTWAQRMHSNKEELKKFNALPADSLDGYIKNKTLKVKIDLYPGAKYQLLREKIILDSLKKEDKISDNIYNFYCFKIKMLQYILDIETNRLSFTDVIKIITYHKETDQELNWFYYHKFLDSVISKYYIVNIKSINHDDGVNKDYCQLFDMIDTSHIFSQNDKKYLLTREIERIVKSFPRDVFLEYFKKYEFSSKDTIYTYRIKRKYELEFDSSRIQTKSVVLLDMQGNKLTLEKVIKENSGKMIYIDYWASWCGPCRSVLPTSVKLRRKLLGKNVVFVYLSIDDSPTWWEKAVNEENLKEYKFNYLIVNHKSSEFLKKNKLNEIPRYMLFDKAGTLIYANAPRVENSNLEMMLTKLAEKY